MIRLRKSRCTLKENEVDLPESCICGSVKGVVKEDDTDTTDDVIDVVVCSRCGVELEHNLVITRS